MLNPISFRPGPVTFWTTLVYLALLIPVIVINETVPPAPAEHPGVNLTEAWLDLATLTKHYHPFNSHYNDVVHDWLLARTKEILVSNGVSWTQEDFRPGRKDADVTVFDDVVANATFLFAGSTGPKGGMAAYYEGTNIYVYIKGSEDEDITWWDTNDVDPSRYSGKGLTLVNAHYDSVASGYGATDNGMGVITLLQLIRYFTGPGNQPRRGIVALLNNGEEDFLYGARLFVRSPLLPYIHTFLNLEGAGAGGRALLFRTSDQEVTAAYAGTEDPFGTVITSDAFGLGFIRSQTDFVVLDGIYGQRGLDLAFYNPRSRYHTNQDDITHTSRRSLWHMLSASIHTMENLSGDMAGNFDGPRPDGARDKVDNGTPSDGVWFDIFGKGFVLFNLRGMFAWSLTVLVVTPLALLLVTYLLHKADKYYFFTSRIRTYEQPDYEPVSLAGWKGLFRFPLALGFAVALSLGAAFLLRKVNPLIINSSRYSVWGMFFSLFYVSFWAIMRGANFVRPSALHRGYVNIWLFVLGWAVLVAITVYEDRFRISAGYILVFLQSAIFLSTLITLLELFALPKRTTWGQQAREDHEARHQLLGSSYHSEDLISPTPGEAVTPLAREEEHDSEDEGPNESTPLVGGNSSNDNTKVTFATTYRRSISAVVNAARKANVSKGDSPFESEQAWSARLPSWTWWFQFLLLGPIIIVLAAQAGLTLVDAIYQTGYDGSSTLFPFLLMIGINILILLPLSPFIHRVTHHIPVVLLVVFIATLTYNLATFPYSANARLVTMFQQTVDLDTGVALTHFHGLDEYVRAIVAEMPSASGKELSFGEGRYPGTVDCHYDSSLLKPNLGAADEKLVTINVTRGAGNKATFEIDAVDTKGCFLDFDFPLTSFTVRGSSGWEERFGHYPDNGIGQIKLWRRSRGKPWVVDVEWADLPPADGSARGLGGQLLCDWSDANTPGNIPAFDEALKFAPTWAAVSKRAEGLVVGTKKFKIES
ncbi:hypothetical protein GQ53DRAFT_871243 [Thozetella sp. PMI_491]|nr:hypothetical protein GQ53DRAFT_871243 [Thozetella sp. PMI_491]